MCHHDISNENSLLKNDILETNNKIFKLGLENETENFKIYQF